VLFTDIDLGDGPNGLEVAAAAIARWSKVRVIYVSGQLLTDGMRALMVEGSTFMSKPYTPDQMEEAIRAVLAGRSAPDE
jgi:DNA-binding NarL/FixJ family response regulator